MAELAILIPSWNTEGHLCRCLASLAETIGEGIAYEIIVVDNGSTDGTAAMVQKQFPGVRLIQNQSNLGFTKAVNQAISASSAPYLLLLNSDIVLLKETAEVMMADMRRDTAISMLACRLLNLDGSVQYFCWRLPTLGVAFFLNTFLERIFPHNRILARYHMREFKHDEFRQVEQPPGCLWLFRRSVVDTIGLLDERMFLFFSDVDYCLRMKRKGLKIFFTPEASAIHEHAVATKKLLARDPEAELIWHRDRFTYYRTHFGFFAVFLIKSVLCIDFLIRTIELVTCVLRGAMRTSQLTRQIRIFKFILAG